MVSPEKALLMAEDVGLDLVEISPNASPPVCKIMDFGKYKYEQQKRESEAIGSVRELRSFKSHQSHQAKL